MRQALGLSAPRPRYEEQIGTSSLQCDSVDVSDFCFVWGWVREEVSEEVAGGSV